MKSKSCCNPAPRPPAINNAGMQFLGIAVCVLACVLPAAAGGDAPQWMHTLVGVPLPSYDEKTDAVLLYSETNVTVLSTDKIKTHVRRAYKILRPSGRELGTAYVALNPQKKVKS